MSGLPGPGHNQPPDDPIERSAELVAAAERWVAERPQITDAEMAGTAQEFINQLRANKTDLEAAEKAEREPFDQAVGVIRVRYRSRLELIGIALAKMREKIKPWLDAEQARIDQAAARRQQEAEAARQQALDARAQADQTGSVEAEAKARQAEADLARIEKAAARGKGPAQVKGDLAPRAMSIRTTHYAVLIDEKKALQTYIGDPAVRAAGLLVATRLASALAKETRGDATRCPPGFEFRRKETPT
jgi:hypothetical protein